MLKQRIITALIMAPLALAGLFLFQVVGFYWFVGSITAVAAWEWARMSGFEAQSMRIAYAVYVSVWLIFVRYVDAAPIMYIGLAWWAVAIVLVLSYPGLKHLWRKRSVKMSIGLLVLIPFWRAMLAIREGELASFLPGDLSVLSVILYALLLIWAADTGAYFCGRAWGKAKLAPMVSPGKSWAGAWGGIACTLLLTLGVAYYIELGPDKMVIFLLVGALTAVVSIFGDLAESMFKREAGIKDSSNLLPGHGGVLDRIDSLTAAIPVLTAVLYGMGWIVAS